MSLLDLRRIKKTINSIRAKTIATSLIHTKIDYCNSLFLNIPRRQLILNFAARAVSKTPRFTHNSPVLKSLHWLNVDQRIHYKITTITYKTLQSRPPVCTMFICRYFKSLHYHMRQLLFLLLFLLLLLLSSASGTTARIYGNFIRYSKTYRIH